MGELFYSHAILAVSIIYDLMSLSVIHRFKLKVHECYTHRIISLTPSFFRMLFIPLFLIADYSLPLRWRYTITITTTKTAAIVPIASNPDDFAAVGGGVVGWSFASPGKVRLFISSRFV